MSTATPEPLCVACVCKQALGIMPRFRGNDDDLFTEDEEDRALFAHALPWKTLCLKMGWGMGDRQVGTPAWMPLWMLPCCVFCMGGLADVCGCG